MSAMTANTITIQCVVEKLVVPCGICGTPCIRDTFTAHMAAYCSKAHQKQAASRRASARRQAKRDAQREASLAANQRFQERMKQMHMTGKKAA